MKYIIKDGDLLLEKSTKSHLLKVVRWKSGGVTVDTMHRIKGTNSWCGAASWFSEAEAKNLLNLLQKALTTPQG